MPTQESMLARSAPQHELVAHELRVVFAEGALGRCHPWIRRVGALGPFPDVAEALSKSRAGHGGQRVEVLALQEVAPRGAPRARGDLPFGLPWVAAFDHRANASAS